MSKSKPSPQTQQEALAVAKATQRPGQTKEQTRLIAQGIQKGIEEYKKQQKAKARERDKAQKKAQRKLAPHSPAQTEPSRRGAALPWWLLGASWLLFIGFHLMDFLLLRTA